MFGTKILEEIKSPINGEIKVVKDLVWGTYIQVDGLTQSGGIVESIWRSTLKKVKGKKGEVKDVLILGLGGGTVAKLVRKFWPASKVVGIDIDLLMIEMGKKYLKLDETKVDITIMDAQEYLSKKLKVKSQKFDLIIADTYCGHNYPKGLESENYIHLISNNLASDGVAVFNRLYFGEKRPEAMKFGRKLEKIFSKVEYFYPEANLMLICEN